MGKLWKACTCEFHVFHVLSSLPLSRAWNPGTTKKTHKSINGQWFQVFKPTASKWWADQGAAHLNGEIGIALRFNVESGRNLDKMLNRGNWNWLGREFFNVLYRLKGWKLSGWDPLYISVHWCNLSENFIVAEHCCSALGWLVRLRNGEAKGVAWNVEWTEWTSMDISICRFWKGQTKSLE